MESRKKVFNPMKNLKTVIKDVRILSRGIIYREGFPFTCVTEPANIYDAIIIKPTGVVSFSPEYPMFDYTIDEYIKFINNYGIEKACIIVNNIDFIKYCPSLKYLQIIPSNCVGDGFDYSPLSELPKILYLKCATKYGVDFKNSTHIDYSIVNGLNAVNIDGDGHKNLNLVSTLEEVTISQNNSKRLSDMIGSEKLNSLELVQCGFETLEGIQKASNLQQLELYYNRFLFDLTALEKIAKSLKTLTIIKCPKIQNFEFLEKLENLEEFSIYGKNYLPNLNFIKKLKKLRSFAFDIEIGDGDLTPCLKLEHAYCAKNKKKYNLHNKELPKKS